jgi:hypothetical protein
MEVSQDLTTPEVAVPEDMEVQEEEEILEMTEVEEDVTIEMEIETATADVVDGKTVKLKDLNFLIISR